MDDNLEMAIEAINNYLISLLAEKNFCTANKVGGFLRALVEIRDDNRTIAEEPPPADTCGSGAPMRTRR